MSYQDSTKCPGVLLLQAYFSNQNREAFQGTEIQTLEEHLKGCGLCRTIARHSAIIGAGKQATTPTAVLQKTIRQYLEESIREHRIWDASGTLTPETIWHLACFMDRGIDGRFTLDSEFTGMGDDASIAVTLAVANLVEMNSKAAGNGLQNPELSR